MFRRTTLFLFCVGCATAGGSSTPDAFQFVDVDAANVRPPDADLSGDQPDAAPRPQVDANVGQIDARPLLHPDAAPQPDAIAQAIDATVPSADAAPGTPDAAPAPDVAPGCTTMKLSLLGNGDFDSSNLVFDSTNMAYSTYDITPWTEGGTNHPYADVNLAAEMPSGVSSQGGIAAAWFGGDVDLDETLSQSITIPADATSVDLAGYVWVQTSDSTTTAFDTLDFVINDGSDHIIGGVDNTAAPTTSTWSSFDLPLTPTYAGKTVTFTIHSANDVTAPTSFYVDTLSLVATVCR